MKNEFAPYDIALAMKELAPYLPYGLKVWCSITGHSEHYSIKVVEGINIKKSKALIDMAYYEFDEFKPILRPLSDLESHKLYPLIKDNLGFRYDDLKDGRAYNSSFGIVERLISYHFDVFDLISKGLAIDINTLDKETKD